jgi:hypothetical protein
MTMIAEGSEAKRQEDAIAKRKRELEEKKRWEGVCVSGLPLSFNLSAVVFLAPFSQHMVIMSGDAGQASTWDTRCLLPEDLRRKEGPTSI